MLKPQSIVTRLLHMFKEHVTVAFDWGWGMAHWMPWLRVIPSFRSTLPYSTSSVLQETELCNLQRVTLLFLCLTSGHQQPSRDWLQEQGLGFYQLHLQAIWRSDGPRSDTILHESRKVRNPYLGQLLSHGILLLYFGFRPPQELLPFFNENLRAVNSRRRLQDPVLLHTRLVTKDFFYVIECLCHLCYKHVLLLQEQEFVVFWNSLPVSVGRASLHLDMQSSS